MTANMFLRGGHYFSMESKLASNLIFSCRFPCKLDGKQHTTKFVLKSLLSINVNRVAYSLLSIIS